MIHPSWLYYNCTISSNLIQLQRQLQLPMAFNFSCMMLFSADVSNIIRDQWFESWSHKIRVVISRDRFVQWRIKCDSSHVGYDCAAVLLKMNFLWSRCLEQELLMWNTGILFPDSVPPVCLHQACSCIFLLLGSGYWENNLLFCMCISK
jgi:hypothetical protein